MENKFNAIQQQIRQRFVDANDIPKEIFSDPVVYEEELKRFFYGPYWHPVAHRAELPLPGSFKTTWLADVPLLVTRSAKDDAMRVMVNSCAHRGALLEQRACGQSKEFECPYHRWLFDTEGAFRGAPGRKEFRADFRDENYGLRHLRVGEFCGLVFVTLDAAAPALTEFLGEASASLADAMLDEGRLTLLGYQRVIYQSNWKAYIDNDPYHAPLLHTAFSQLGWKGSAGQLISSLPYGHMCINYEIKPYVDNGYLDDPSLVEFRGTDDRARVIALRPVTGITKHLDTINIRFARPLGPLKTEVWYGFFGHEDDTPEFRQHRIRQSSNLLGPSGFISIEDAAMYNRVTATAKEPDGYQHFIKGVGKPRKTWTQNDEVPNTDWWAHYREMMGFC